MCLFPCLLFFPEILILQGIEIETLFVLRFVILFVCDQESKVKCAFVVALYKLSDLQFSFALTQVLISLGSTH